MASVHGHYVTSDKVGYNVSKFGLRGLTQSIAAEGEGEIRSFSVSTGYVKTPLVTNQLEDTAQQRGISVGGDRGRDARPVACHGDDGAGRRR